MPKAIVVEAVGGPEVLRLAALAMGEPGRRELRVRQHTTGVNFIDIYHRTGLYEVVQLPLTPGIEGAGEHQHLPG